MVLISYNAIVLENCYQANIDGRNDYKLFQHTCYINIVIKIGFLFNYMYVSVTVMDAVTEIYSPVAGCV